VKKIQNHFLRYEFKYILPEKIKTEVECELAHFLQLDSFVESINNKRYFVRSLYFDNPSYGLYYEKIDGLKHRQKFRIRTYQRSYDENTPIYLELKGRYNNYVYKHRVPVSIESSKEEQVNISSLICKRLLRENNNNPIAQQFVYDTIVKNIKPVMLIDYQRRPYQSKYDHEFRVTFDDVLYGTQTNTLFPKDEVHSRSLISGYTIMEIKFGKHVPAWFHKIMIKYQLERVSVSKYCLGMQSTDLVEEDL